jgi:uncharacterized lipoprotein YddW (UPF0748 family)
VQGHWAQPCIQQLAQKQIISGYPDGTFRPNAVVTRAEFAAMIRKAFPNAPEVRQAVQFVDVPTKYWAAEAIRKAYSTGFVSGYPGRTFNPTQKIERSQVIVSLASGLKYSPTQPVANTLNTAFSDASAIPNYARNGIAAATEKQIVVNYPSVKRINPNQQASRAEVAAFFCQALGNVGLVPSQYIAKVGTPATPTAELRGVWLTNIDSDVLFERDRLSKALQRLDDLNFNTIYPTVWNWGYTLYPSKVAERVFGRSLDPEPGLKGRDIIKEMVDVGHQKGLTVIPWFEFGFMAPADSELAKRRADWVTTRRDGSKIWKEGKHDRVWLNPFRPEVQQFIQDLILEIVSNYDIDGIQFDDHFGLPAELGYDDFTVKLYKQEHNGKAPSNNPQDPEWVKWRSDKITKFMNQVFQAIKARKQNCLVSVSPNPQRFSYEFFLADWETWERQGLIEELILQVYRDDINVFIKELESPEVQAAQRHIPVSIGILAGLKDRSVPLRQIQAQVEAVRDRNFAGVSFFFYETLWNLAQEKPTERLSAFEKFFPTAVKAPNLLVGWKPN